MQESPYLDGREFLVEKFHKLPFLGAIHDNHIKKILKLSKIRKYENGEVITPEGAFDNWVYILLSGVVNVIKDEKIIATLDEIGETFGELAVIDGKSRSASVQACGETVCLAIDASFMEKTSEPLDQVLFVSILYRLFAEVIAHRLRTSNEELIRLRTEVERLTKENNRNHK